MIDSLANTSTGHMPSVLVADHLGDAVALQHGGELPSDGRRIERRPLLADTVNNNNRLLPVGAISVADAQREAVGAAAARIDEAVVGDADARRPSYTPRSTRLDRLQIERGVDVLPKLATKLSRRRSRVSLIGAINYTLRQRRIEVAARTFRDQDERIAGGAVMSSEGPPQLATSRIRDC